MSRRLIALRHGETEYNATGRMQGHLDTLLSARGQEQARVAAQYLRTQDITHIVSSDLARAHATADAVGELLGVEVTTDPRLRETHLGQWQAMSHEEVDATWPGARALWRHDATWAPPGGETRLEVAARARAVVDELMGELDTWDDSTVLLVAHGGTISALTCNLLGLEHSQYPLLSGLKNTCWAQLVARPRFVPRAGEEEDFSQELRFTPETVADAQWYLDGWNMGVAQGRATLPADTDATIL
ncbi:histidine phosphatase family protein [Corynebacterium sp. 13CS0277]|uniref:histidine phosphatase family protein n=1 Tax=Corynebacterium sp. 13CS0277 TaxID=2071994 RepID=UPI000D03CE86|nr:histidine phosphatase family protein [Corynebacterium sp. 13CS0277]PRQ11671.1 histidine phosphatase family protein [Corynebacterium sp. 13CS0277]